MMSSVPASPANVDDVVSLLDTENYVADRRLATSVFLALELGRPLFVEGEPGVGKTELAKALARALDAKLLRLQCYEGLDEARTLYEWKYGKQLLYIQLLRDSVAGQLAGAGTLAEAIDRLAATDDAFFSERFLDARPLLQAIRADQPVVLLIDEVDRAEDELEAFFLEALAELQVTVPELGTFRATRRPVVVLTSNATRELSDALRRRCLYLPMDYPDTARETAIVEVHVPEVGKALAGELVRFVAGLRGLDLRKRPSIAETLDWARALVVLGAGELGEDVVRSTLALLLKYEGDLELAQRETPALIAAARRR